MKKKSSEDVALSIFSNLIATFIAFGAIIWVLTFENIHILARCLLLAVAVIMTRNYFMILATRETEKRVKISQRDKWIGRKVYFSDLFFNRYIANKLFYILKVECVGDELIFVIYVLNDDVEGENRNELTKEEKRMTKVVFFKCARYMHARAICEEIKEYIHDKRGGGFLLARSYLPGSVALLKQGKEYMEVESE